MSLPTGPGDEKKGPSTTRIVIWLVVGAIALYMVISGVMGIIAKG